MGCLAISLARQTGLVEQVAAQVKETFQRFGIDMADETRLRAACETGATHRAFGLLEASLRETLQNEMPCILVVETAADAASKLLKRLKSGNAIAMTKNDGNLFGEDFVQALRMHNRHPKHKFGILPSLERERCPCCHARLDADILKRLRHTHAAVCPHFNCKRALIWLPESPSLQSASANVILKV
jgi:hypothetical protein